MKGFVAVLSLVLLALVCNSGALHVPAAGVAAAQECCVRNTDNASFQQFHDRDSIRQKKDSDITGIVIKAQHLDFSNKLSKRLSSHAPPQKPLDVGESDDASLLNDRKILLS